MFLKLFIEGVAVSLAVAGLLLQPKKDSSRPPSWANLTGVGRIILGLILIAGFAKTVKAISDERSAAAQRVRQAEVIEQQKNDLADLRETNAHLIKVMSVAGGYNAQLHGVVTLRRASSEAQVRDAIENLFLKYAFVTLNASNKLGEYSGRVDYGTHPELRRYRAASALGSDTELTVHAADLSPSERSRSFYFEVRCGSLKILNHDRIQYVRFANDHPVSAKVESYPVAWRDFQQLYGVERIYLDRIVIEELGEVTLNHLLR